MDSCIPVCNCNASLGNTGYDCLTLMDVAQKLIFIPTYTSTGTLNYMDLTVTLDQAYFSARINDTDTSKRWYVTPDLNNVNDKRADAVTEKMSDDTEEYIRDGVGTFEGVFLKSKGSPKMKKSMDTLRCNAVSVLVIDKVGNIIGRPSSDSTKLYPVRIDEGSVNAILMKASDSTVPKLGIKFNWHTSENDACLGLISANDLASDATPLTWKGLLDVKVKFSAISTAGVTATLYTDFGTVLAPTTVKGAVIAEFISYYTAATSKARNITSGAEVALSTVTETPANSGIYVIVFTAAQTVGHKIAFKLLKTGYDGAPMVALPVTIA
jgi:hypothetical protein